MTRRPPTHFVSTPHTPHQGRAVGRETGSISSAATASHPNGRALAGSRRSPASRASAWRLWRCRKRVSPTLLSSSTPNTPPPFGRRSTTSTLPPLSPAVCQMDRRAGSSCPSSFQPSQAGPSGAASCLQASQGRARRGGEQWHPLATRLLLRPPQPSPQLPAPTQGRWRTHLPCQLHLARLGSTVAAGAAPQSGRAAGAKTGGPRADLRFGPSPVYRTSSFGRG